MKITNYGEWTEITVSWPSHPLHGLRLRARPCMVEETPCWELVTPNGGELVIWRGRGTTLDFNPKDFDDG